MDAAGVIQDLSVYRKRALSKLEDILDDKTARDIEQYMLEDCEERQSVADKISHDNPLFRMMYVSKARQIIDNLSSDSYINNTFLIHPVKDGNITPLQLVRMSPQEMFPSRWHKLIEAKKRRDEIQYNTTTQAMTDVYVCRKCGSRKITYYDLQIRSADEGFTTFYTCLGCGSKWKKN